LRQPAPGPLPSTPPGLAGAYVWDHEQRLVRADVSGPIGVSPADARYLISLFERPDITVVVKGLGDDLTSSVWSTAFLETRCGDAMYFQFRRYVRDDEGGGGSSRGGGGGGDSGSSSAAGTWREVGTDQCWRAMRISDYFRYLRCRAAALRWEAGACGADADLRRLCDGFAPAEHDGGGGFGNGGGGGGGGSSDGHGGGGDSGGSASNVGRSGSDGGGAPFLLIADDRGRRHEVRPLSELLYLIDLDVPRHLPEAGRDLAAALRMDLLPAGAHCALQHLPPEGRPFLGPNLYITPPGASTHVHQDGHGTVDSGHLCLTGRNDVVILRRMDAVNKAHVSFYSF
ncbi:unnamed protein product, partial [Phaeothamnion confervicola]